MSSIRARKSQTNGKTARQRLNDTPISTIADLGAQLHFLAKDMRCSVDKLLERAETSKTFKKEYEEALDIAGMLRTIGYK